MDVTASEWQFSPNPIEVPAGRVGFHVTNAGKGGHDFTILSPDGRRRLAQSPVLAPGDATMVTVTLRPGTYEVICSLPGHQDLGMQAAIHVT